MRAGEILKSVWPQWDLVREIGSGSFGHVYEISRRMWEANTRRH